MESPMMITLRREPGPLTRSLVAFVLRTALGVMFLIAGVQKFEAKQAGKYPGMIVDQFENTILGKRLPWALKLFADTLPYAEVALGGALILGFWTTLTAFLTGVLLVKLLFGLLLVATTPEAMAKIPSHFLYILTDAAILWLSPVTSNYLSLDGLLFGWFWKPKTEGEYRRTSAP